MAFDTSYRKSGDVSPALTATITRPEESGNVDLTGANSVTLYARAPDETMEITDASATIVTAADGTVSYTVGASEFDATGEYEVEWKVYWVGDDSDSERYPKKDYQQVHVTAELA